MEDLSFGSICGMYGGQDFLQGKGKATPLQAWTGPEGSRSLRLPDFKTFSMVILSALHIFCLYPPFLLEAVSIPGA
jgi:hypothetical protein